ncbi:MAG: tRNA dimethylallyltransferase [Planctomycetota bacterium]
MPKSSYSTRWQLPRNGHRDGQTATAPKRTNLYHLIDICDPNESFSLSQYRDRAVKVMREIISRVRQVLVVGGTALYLKALLRGMFEGPQADWEFRNQIKAEIEEAGSEFLHKRLAMVDPVSAHNLHPNDHRRIIRDFEVY